jgi:YbbR domain-containing protein
MKSKEWSAKRPHHWLAKIICLLIAVFFWLYVMYAAAPTYDAYYTDIPVTVIASGDFSGETGTLTSVRVFGTKAALSALRKEDIRATVYLANAGSTPLVIGEYATLTVELALPEGITAEGSPAIPVLIKAKGTAQ